MSDPGRIRFGLFDFDPATHELRREGAALRLQSQPAHVLALLLAQAGEVVTRESLREAIWGTETFVDFDRGLNFCITQIRSALGDSAQSPRFIKTLPKRGYQFIAPIASTAAAAPIMRPLVSKGRVAILSAVTAVVIALVVFALPQPPITVAVTRFDNQTGNPEFDRLADGLTDQVVAELTAAGSKRFAVIGNAAILRLPREKRDLLAIGSSLKAGYVVLGQVQRGSTGVLVLAHLIRLPEQTHVKVFRADSDSGDLARRIGNEFAPRITPHRAL